MNAKHLFLLATMLATTLPVSLTFAHEASAGEETVVPLQQQKLADVPGKQVVMAIVSYTPGQASKPHRHSGSVFAYVIEGEVISQLEGQPPVSYKAGQSWYEPPLVPHLVSRNASKQHGAKLLAWLLMDEGGQTKEALPK
ncbi:MAG: cupin domain-containing protein [Polaromonas sp.]